MKKNFISNTSHLEKKDDSYQLFFTEDGWLTKYALACGYKERVEVNGNTLDLYLDGCYHVRNMGENYSNSIWECFDTWTAARLFYIQTHRRLTT